MQMKAFKYLTCVAICLFLVSVTFCQTSNKPMSDFFSPEVKSFLQDHPANAKDPASVEKDKMTSNNRQMRDIADGKKKNKNINSHKSSATPAQAKKKMLANDPDLKNKVKKIRKAG